jgi:hypothetical protein
MSNFKNWQIKKGNGDGIVVGVDKRMKNLVFGIFLESISSRNSWV